MDFRVVSWNVDSRPTGNFDAKLELLHRLEPDVALLRELRRPVYRGFIPHAQAYERVHGRPRLFSWGVLSTDVVDPPAPDRRVGCAVLGGRNTTLVETVSLGAKAVAARLVLGDGRPVTVCTALARRTAVGDEAQSRDPDVAAWAAAQAGAVVTAIDTRPPAVGANLARHDEVVITSDLQLRAVEHLEKEALATGSDYAVVVVDLSWNGAVG